MTPIYNAIIEPHPEGGWQVAFPDLPEIILDAPDRAAAHASAVEALGLALRGCLGAGEPLPDAKAEGGIAVEPNIADAMKIALVLAFERSGLSKSELARRMGKGETEARRVLDPYKSSTLPALEAALSALGLRAHVEFRHAA